jgi:hypothetical protein
MCMPCLVNYDRIIKMETFNHDNAWVILNKLKPYQRGLTTAVNRKHGKPVVTDTLTTQGKTMEEYSNVNMNSLSYFTKFYKQDMELFGYSWDFHQQLDKDVLTLHTSCVSGASGKSCC